MLTKLILAHLLGDFLLQPQAWVRSKEQKKLRAWQFYAHLLVHWILLLMVMWDEHFVIPSVVIVLSHAVIDGVKQFAQRESTKRFWFLADQSLHLLVLVIAWYILKNPELNLETLATSNNMLILTCFVFNTLPASIFIKFLISKWAPTVSDSRVDAQASVESLQDAGKYIGILERVLSFTFILINHWEAVGFLIAAKSIFRFGDLKESRELKLTEYVLIGTLLSFGVAIATGLIATRVTF